MNKKKLKNIKDIVLRSALVNMNQAFGLARYLWKTRNDRISDMSNFVPEKKKKWLCKRVCVWKKRVIRYEVKKDG